MRFKDYYKVLEVTEKASSDEIKKSFRRLAKQFHPDANPGNKTAEERFKEINEAYDILGDSTKRSKYDQLRFYGHSDSGNGEWISFDQEFLRNHGWPGGMPGSTGTRGPFGQFFGQGFAFSDLLRDIFGVNGFDSGFEQQKRVSRDINGAVKISFLEALQGTERTISIRQKKNCSTCFGTGQDRYAPCMKCNGTGRISSKKKIRIRIPAGIKNGHQLHLRNIGQDPSYGNGQQPNVLITVQIEPHPFFNRSGDDIYCEASVSEHHLSNGTRVRIPTVEGKKIELNIPAGTKKGTVFRLRNYGVKTANHRGDQFIKII